MTVVEKEQKTPGRPRRSKRAPGSSPVALGVVLVAFAALLWAGAAAAQGVSSPGSKVASLEERELGEPNTEAAFMLEQPAGFHGSPVQRDG